MTALVGQHAAKKERHMYRFILAMVLAAAFTSACGDAGSAAPASSARAADPSYPNRTITMVSPQTAGGVSDLEARMFAPEFAKALGVTVTVIDKTGAANLVGMQYVAKEQPADGYNIVATSSTAMATLPATVKDLAFDPIKDLVPIL